MPPKSKVEKSPHFNEILDMIEKSISPRHISDYLKNEYNESISHTAINNFVKKIRSKTASEYQRQQKAKEKKKKVKFDEVVDKEVANKETIDEVIKKGVSDINALDNIIVLADKIDLDPSKIQVEYGPQGGVIVSEFDVLKAHALVANLVIKATKVRSDILKDEPESPTFIFGLDSKKERLKRIEGNNEYNCPRENSTTDESDS